MTTLTLDNTLERMDELIEVCLDGENGFRAAAEAMENKQIQTVLNGYAQQRAEFAAVLQNEVIRRGGRPERDDELKAAMHRGWLNLKAAITGHDPGAILGECVRGENFAIEQYEQALSAGLPEDLATLAGPQLDAIIKARNHMKELKALYGD